VIVRRWQAYTGKAALDEIGLTFDELEAARASSRSVDAAKSVPPTERQPQ
jgi:hypothetical protein